MTVSSEVNYIEYNGDGVTTTFPIPFYFILNSDISAQIADADGNITDLTYGIDYSVTGAGSSSGGSATMNTAYTSGYKILFYREPPATQETAYYENGKFPAKSHEKALDKLTMLIQSCLTGLGLALRKPSLLASYYDSLNNRIKNLRDPEEAQDAATKSYVDTEVSEESQARQQGDADLQGQINGNLQKTLRVPESYVDEIYPAEARKDSLFGWNSSGKPVPIFNYTGTADLAIKLASQVKGLGGWLVGYARNKITSTIKTVSQMLDASPIYVWEFADLITEKPDLSNPETWDWTPAILAAVAQSKANNFEPVMLPAGKVIVSDLNVVLTSTVRDYSGGSASDGIKYKGVMLCGYGDGVTRLMVKSSAVDTVCINMVGNGGGHKTSAGVKDLSIEPYDSSYQLKGFGIQLNCVNYATISDVSIYMMNENFRFLNGISNGWTEFNKLTRCFSYRGNVCFSFTRTAGNDSFHGTEFTDCFGQIKRNGGIGIKGAGVSSSALVWMYNCKLGIKWYGGEAACKVISLSFAEMTMNHEDMTCEGTVTMETLDDYSRCQHRGRWINNGTTLFSVVSERAGAQGRFTFQNLHSRTGSFVDSNISDYTPGVIPVTPDTYNNNGAGIVYMTGTNFASPMLTCQNYAGNGFYFGQITLNGAIQDVTPSWKLSNDGGILKTYNVAGMRFQVGTSESVRLTSAAFYPFNDNGMTMGLAANRYSNSYVSRRMYTATTGDLFGNGSPEGTVTAGVGSTYRRLDGGTSSSFYVKETGTGNTGWIAK